MVVENVGGQWGESCGDHKKTGLPYGNPVAASRPLEPAYRREGYAISTHKASRCVPSGEVGQRHHVDVKDFVERADLVEAVVARTP